MKTQIGVENILEAHRRIKDSVRETFLDYSPFYSKRTGSNVFLKLENLQITGSFKLRGALNKMIQLAADEMPAGDENNNKPGVVAASAGNHGQGIAFAARKLNIPATIVVPENTPQVKRDAIARYGVELIVEGKIYDEAEQNAIRLAAETDRRFISPYNDRDIICGQGTVALEILNQLPETEVLLVPVSGGGLLAGMAVAAKHFKPDLKIYGIQSEACPVMAESLRQGRIVSIPMKDSLAEGLHGGIEKDSITFPLIQDYVDDILLVSEEELKESIIDLVKNHHQIAEASGAATAAALLRYKNKWKNKNVVAVISGGNLDIETLRFVIKPPCSNTHSIAYSPTHQRSNHD